jgi:hypothetical protein
MSFRAISTELTVLAVVKPHDSRELLTVYLTPGEAFDFLRLVPSRQATHGQLVMQEDH